MHVVLLSRGSVSGFTTSTDWPVQYSVVSSAYLNVVADFISDGRSPVKVATKVGPKIDLCGMPNSTGGMVDSAPLTSGYCCMSLTLCSS